MMQLKMSAKGELVIPKKIREQFGLFAGRKILMVIQDKEIVLKPLRQSIVKKWAERARRMKLDASKWVMGDELYEEGEYF